MRGAVLALSFSVFACEAVPDLTFEELDASSREDAREDPDAAEVWPLSSTLDAAPEQCNLKGTTGLPDCDGCIQTLPAECCIALDVCLGDVSCKANLACVRTCKKNGKKAQTCLADCNAQHPDNGNRARNAIACVPATCRAKCLE